VRFGLLDNQNETIMKNYIPVLIASVVLATVTGSAFARAGGGAGGGFGGVSSPHTSTQGVRNSNGPNSADRDKGLARAQDRMSAKGKAGSKSGKGHSKRKARKHHGLSR
jgi:hypothetical protein